MQELRASASEALLAGTLVEARRARWLVRSVKPGDTASLVHLTAAERREPGARALLSPFDRIAGVAPRSTAVVSRRRFMRRLGALCAETHAFGVPASAASADVALMAFQLAPLLALDSGLAARLLIADEVGLGKTIQAALIVRDLLTRWPDASILIVTPAGLREQWQGELRDRAGLEATMADATWLRALQACLPPAANPWSLARLPIVSIDFVKQPEILRGLRRVVWSLLVIDEAHLVSPGTDRFDAAACLAERSERVVLLTATPHDGDDRRFAALCELGRLGPSDPLALFRRRRDDLPRPHALATPPRRSVHRLYVRPSAAEARLHRLLDRYVRHVWRQRSQATQTGGRLAMSVLVKRAASSAWSLEQSLRRRRDLLAVEPDGPTQAGLDFGSVGATSDVEDADAAPDAVLGTAALAPARERTWLNVLISAAATAAAGERKVAALTRLLRRVREPVIVFTEYRDTLQRIADALGKRHTVTCLHGGLDTDMRRRAIAAFSSGTARVLIATDAGSQGLNLQHRCRLVVHMELPWNPLRLDQRNGRVDRIGQTRAVHAIHLIGRSMIEATIEARLDDRRRRISAAMSAAAFGGTIVDEIALLDEALTTPAQRDAAATSMASAGLPLGTDAAQPAQHPSRDVQLTWPDLGVEADSTARQLTWMRAIGRSRGALDAETCHTPSVTRLAPKATRRAGFAPGRLCLHRTRVRDGEGTIHETTLSVHHLARGPFTRLSGGRDDGAADASMAAVSRQLNAHAARRALELARLAARGSTIANDRRKAIVQRMVATREPDQLELFDDHSRSHETMASASRHMAATSASCTAPGNWSAEVSTVLVAFLE